MKPQRTLDDRSSAVPTVLPDEMIYDDDTNKEKASNDLDDTASATNDSRQFFPPSSTSAPTSSNEGSTMAKDDNKSHTCDNEDDDGLTSEQWQAVTSPHDLDSITAILPKVRNVSDAALAEPTSSSSTSASDYTVEELKAMPVATRNRLDFSSCDYSIINKVIPPEPASKGFGQLDPPTQMRIKGVNIYGWRFLGTEQQERVFAILTMEEEAHYRLEEMRAPPPLGSQQVRSTDAVKRTNTSTASRSIKEKFERK